MSEEILKKIKDFIDANKADEPEDKITEDTPEIRLLKEIYNESICLKN